jgi:hypothetical protein
MQDMPEVVKWTLITVGSVLFVALYYIGIKATMVIQ